MEFSELDRGQELNIFTPNQTISYRMDVSRCTSIGIQDGILMGTVFSYDNKDNKEHKVVYSVVLPLGKWEIVDEDKHHRVTLKRIG